MVATRSRIFHGVVVVVLSAMTMIATAGAWQDAQPAPQPRPSVSKALAPTLKRAQDALMKREYGVVLAELATAEAMPEKSEFDQYVIDQMRLAAKARMAKEVGR